MGMRYNAYRQVHALWGPPNHLHTALGHQASDATASPFIIKFDVRSLRHTPAPEFLQPGVHVLSPCYPWCLIQQRFR